MKNFLSRNILSIYFNAWMLCLLILVAPVCAQEDPLVLQQRAIKRIDSFKNHFWKTGDFEQKSHELELAEAELAESNRLLKAKQNRPALTIGLLQQAAACRMRNQWAQAIDLYQQAEEMARQGDDLVHQAEALAWKGVVELSRMNVGQALADATRSVEIAQKTTDNDVLAHALGVLGNVKQELKDFSGAAETANREVAAATHAREPMALYHAFRNRADVFHSWTQQCDYRPTYDLCYQSLDRARSDVEQALVITRRLGFLGLQKWTEGLAKDVENRRELIRIRERGESPFRNAPLFHPKTPEKVLVTENFRTPSDGLLSPEMLLYYKQIKARQETVGLAEGLQAKRLYSEGMIKEMQGDNDAALVSFLQAVGALERDRRSLHDVQSRGSFIEGYMDYFYTPSLLLLERRRYAEAFELIERSRSRALVDLLAGRKISLRQEHAQQLYGEVMEMRSEIANLQNKLFEEVNTSGAQQDAGKITSYHDQIHRLESQEKMVLAQLRQEAPRTYDLMDAPTVSLKALQQSMRDEGYEVLQYIALENALIVWHIKADSLMVRNVFLPKNELGKKVAALRQTLESPNIPFDETSARELFLFLIQPVLSHFGGKRLVIIPHDDLNQLPFQVLLDPKDGKSFGEQFQLTYAPSATILLGCKPFPGLTGSRLLAIADPQIVDSAQEIQAVTRLFPEKLRQMKVDQLATEKYVRERLSGVEVGHLVVHGHFSSEVPMSSHLSLAPGDGEDGKFTAAEMFGLNLENNQLLVFSSCESGRSSVTPGNEILGIVRALLYAGAGTMVLSNWKIDTRATAQWMQTFYEAAVSQPLPEAARTAIIKVKNTPQYSHPHYWGAFNLIGR